MFPIRNPTKFVPPIRHFKLIQLSNRYVKKNINIKNKEHINEGGEYARKINWRASNFSAGPSALNMDVIKQISTELFNYNNSGMSILEMSHREENGDVQRLITDCSFRIRNLLNIPNNYHIFFQSSGAHAQFAAIPLNLISKSKIEDTVGGYVNTGYWSQKARNEASKFIKTVEICKSDGKTIPNVSDWNIPNNCEYIHICANETISGIEFLTDPELPNTDNSPILIADFTSTLFSRPIDIEKYGMIYASSGKNFGPSGVTIVIIKDELIGASSANQYVNSIPSVLNWSEYANSLPVHSIYNTPPIFQIYSLNLTLKIIYENIFNNNMNLVSKWVHQRSNTIYKIIEQFPTFYQNNIDKSCRSVMNIPFRIYDHHNNRINSVFEYKFMKEGNEDWSLRNFNGHYTCGGQRLSLYTSIPDESIKAFAQFMLYFGKSYSIDINDISDR